MLQVHPDDRKLFGMRWKKKVWLYAALLFGLRSASKVFNVMADCLHRYLNGEAFARSSITWMIPVLGSSTLRELRSMSCSMHWMHALGWE